MNEAGVNILMTIVFFAMTLGAVLVGGMAFMQAIKAQQGQFDRVLRGNLLLDVSPRGVMILTVLGIAVLTVIGMWVTKSLIGAFLVAVAASFLPPWVLKKLKEQRILKLEEQLVGGIQTLSAAVRAGLNLVQAMQMIVKDGATPLRQEFAHLLKEYEYGVPLGEAMTKAADRIGSSDYHLLFSALKTFLDRGGDLGETLDRIATSIREIQRLEQRVKMLTAQGRANARMLGILVVLVMFMMYAIAPDSVHALFRDSTGMVILAIVVTLNLGAFLWIRKIMDVDI